MGYIAPRQRLDDPPFPQDPFVAGSWGGKRRHAKRTVEVAATDLEDLILAPPGDETRFEG